MTEGQNYPVKQETQYGGLEAQVKVKLKVGWPYACQLSEAHHTRGSYLSLGMFSWQEMS